MIVLSILVFKNNAKAKATTQVFNNNVKLTTHTQTKIISKEYPGFRNRCLFGGVNNCKQKKGICVIQLYN